MNYIMDFDLREDRNMKTILSELKEIEEKILVLINRLESKNTSITTTIGEVRKYRKSPSSTTGYYSGNKPSLAAMSG